MAWDRNPRRNDGAVDAVAKSIRRFGFGAPVLARAENREVIAGHTRVRAAAALGMTEVPVRFLDLDPADAHLLAIADNKLGELAEWDTTGVLDILSGSSLDDAALVGFDGAALEKMAGDVAADDDGGNTGPVLGGITYSVVVECRDEQDQASLLGRLELEGRACRPLMS